MSHSVRQHLGVEIEAYDAAIRRFIPGYEEMLSIAALEADRDGPGLVLDLGAGTGALSEAILLASPDAEVGLIDVDTEMLSRARSRLEPFGSRARFLERSFLEPLPSCGGIAAALALHHIPTMPTKRALYRRAQEALGPGGVFVNADAAVPAEAKPREAILRMWVEHMASNGITEEEGYRNLEQWAEEDTYFPLEEELSAVADAGLEPECVWSQGPISVVVGRKQR